MKKIFSLLAACFVLASCQDKDIEIAAPILEAPAAESISGALQDDDYVWTWNNLGSNQMQVTLVVNGTKSGSETVTGNSYTHKTVDTNVKYQYVFKLTDGTNISKGVIKEFTRLGADKVKSISMSQQDTDEGYDILVEWEPSKNATKQTVLATNGESIISMSLLGQDNNFVIPNVLVGDEWTVTIREENESGTSLPTTSSLKIGKTAVAFLSIYDTPEELVEVGDDDEASAWLWFNKEYPTGKFLPFSQIKEVADVEPYRVMFWMRDLEGVGESEVFNMPQVVMEALEPIQTWYKAGGSLLLWSHAMPFVATLGRIPMEAITNNDRAIGTGFGGYNGDDWKMAVCLNPGGKFKADASNHPLFRGLEYEETDRTKLIAMKGPGWTEDHNCLFFNYPPQLTGLGNQEQACYENLTRIFGIYPLATWDSQIDWVSQLNIWEARQGNTEFQGTVLCIGNGGCEFSLKNEDGTPDKSAYPKNNSYQNNVLKMAKNAIEYLKTR